MSLSNYSDLTGSGGISAWLDHTLFSGSYGTFVQLFEATANRRLRVREMEAKTTLTPDTSGHATLPSDYLTWRRVTWTGQTRRELAYVHPSYLQASYPTQPADIPQFFTIEGSILEVMPLDSTGLEFDYYQAIPGLAANSTNWLMTAHPDLYLFGSMCEVEAFGVNDERMPMWKARRDEIFEEIIMRDRQTRGPSHVRVFGVTP